MGQGWQTAALSSQPSGLDFFNNHHLGERIFS